MNEIFKYIKNKTSELFEITIDLIYYIHNKNDLKKSFFSEKKIPNGCFTNISFVSISNNYTFKFEITDTVIDDENYSMIDGSICNESGLEILKFVSYNPSKYYMYKFKKIIEIYN